MKRNLLIFSLLVWMLTACGSQPHPTEQSLIPNDGSSTSDSPSGWTPAQQAAIKALSQNLSLPPGEINMISTETVEWRDGCLGIQKMGVMCTQAIVPGFKIVLEANGEEYEFHTDEDGSQVAQVNVVSIIGPLEDVVIKQLATNLGLSESDILIFSSSEVEFADACLGVAVKDVACDEVVTPGRIIILEADGVQYEYHVSSDGTHVQPATLALTWARDGGIAGFCDRLTVFRSGEVYGNQCQSQPNQTTGSFASLLSADDLAQFIQWTNELGQVNLDRSDPKGVSDRMVVTLAFSGMGNGSLSETDEQALLLWVQSLFQKLYS